MWKFELTVPEDLLPKFEALAAEHGLTPTVTLASPEETTRIEKMTSEEWLVQAILAKDVGLGIYKEKPLRVRLRRYGWSSLSVITRLTFVRFLDARSGLELHIYSVMRDVQATFADGADPAIFPAHPINDKDLTVATVTHLANRAINSWAMMAYLTTRFLRTVDGISQGRVDEIQAALPQHGFALRTM